MNNRTEKDLRQLKKDYQNIPIPPELSQRVQIAIDRESRERRETVRKRPRWQGGLLSAAAACLLFVGAINASATIHTALAQVPGLGALVEVCTFRNYTMNTDAYQANVQVPQLNGLDDDVAAVLNEKYLAEGQALYEQFTAEVAAMQEGGAEGHLGVDSGYEVLTNNDQVFAISRYVVNTVGSSSTELRYDTVDRQNQLIVTLPSLFTDGADYITIISNEIKKQMQAQMASDENIVYWLDDETPDDDSFAAIAADQDFYINSDGKLVISFDKYDVAPGYMGVCQFVIPTEVLSDILLDRGLLH